MRDDDQPTPDEELLAEALAFLMVGRPERLEDVFASTQPEPLRAAMAAARRTIAVLGMLEEPDRAPADLRDRLLASTTRRARREAIVVVDMIRDHLEPGCPLEVPRAREIVPALRARLDDARRRGVPVVFVLDQHEADDADLDAWGAHAIKGTGGDEPWPELAPMPGDRVVRKPSYSSFFETDLEAVLDELRVDSLVLTGCATEIQLKATATDAMQLGFDVEVPVDCQAGAAPELEMATLAVLRLMVPYAPARKRRLARVQKAA